MSLQSKLENEVLNAKSQNVRSMVVRPPMVYGRGGSIIPTVLLQAGRKAGIGLYLGSGENEWSPVAVDDLAALMCSRCIKVVPGRFSMQQRVNQYRSAPSRKQSAAILALAARPEAGH